MNYRFATSENSVQMLHWFSRSNFIKFYIKTNALLILNELFYKAGFRCNTNFPFKLTEDFYHNSLIYDSLEKFK